jgi:hypothetical protein
LVASNATGWTVRPLVGGCPAVAHSELTDVDPGEWV